MTNVLTPDGLLVASALAVAVLCVPLWIFWKARSNGGVAELPLLGRSPPMSFRGSWVETLTGKAYFDDGEAWVL